MIDKVKEVWSWVIKDFWLFALIGLFIAKGGLIFNKLFLEPIQGDDGKVAMDEFTKYVVVILLIYMMIKEGKTEGNTYEPTVFYAMVLLVAAISGFQQLALAFVEYFKNKK